MSHTTASGTDLPPARPGPIAAPIGLGRELGLVAAGGMIGALARAAIATLCPTSLATFALSTQLVNATGALALGLFLASCERGRPRPNLRPFMAVGVLGSFTTFSTLVQDGRRLTAAHSPLLVIAPLAVSIAVGLLAFLLGGELGRKLSTRREARGSTTT